MAFIKCNIKFSMGMSNIVKDFNLYNKLSNVVNLKLTLHTVLQIFVFICSKRVQVQNKHSDKLVTNIPQLIEYGDFCQIISTPIKCILKELLSFGSVAFKWEQNV